MKEMDIKLTSVEVKSEVRNLRCDFTTEMVKTIQSFHGINYDTSLQRRVERMGSIISVFKIKI